MIRRREFIAALSGTAAWSLAARAQQPGVPVIGFLHSATADSYAAATAAFRKSLNEAGYFEGHSVAIDLQLPRVEPPRILYHGMRALIAWAESGKAAGPEVRPLRFVP